ncbi:MAG: F0F1 ATP synthase subunit A [Elusimicrobia bacterium]|nr:F0F1 ATP synthase subunit A [Elusimicrobiota bacterium]
MSEGMVEAAAGGHGGALDFSEILAHHLTDHQLFSLGGGFGVSKHGLMILIAAGLAAMVVLLAARTKGRLRTAVEAFVLFIRKDIAEPALGEDTDYCLPYLLTLFVFILMMNLLGLIPSGATPTGNISVTATLSLLTFVLIHAAGVFRHGLLKHLKNFVPHGVPWVVWPLVWCIEAMGFLTKSIALCIRLFANMTAGHMVILLFLGLILLAGQTHVAAGAVVAPIAVGLAVGLYALELIVALIQAYVFTMLTAIFVGGALHPEH